MTESRRWIAVVAVGAIALVSCARPGGSGSNAQPADIYAAGPTVADVRTLLGDANWWQGAPTFGVRPLDAATTPRSQRFTITQRFIHVGTAETLLVAFTVFNTTTAATALMTTLQDAFSNSVTTPKAGDQVIYVGQQGPSGAPYLATTVVRLGQIVVEIDWARKDGPATTTQLGRTASKIIDGLKRATGGKSHPSPPAVDQKVLPPPGLDITFLGGAKLPVESWLVMNHADLLARDLQAMQSDGVKDFLYGDYVLNSDTHMEVRAALLTFSAPSGAVAWAGNFSTAAQDPTSGIAADYIDAIGEYHFFLVSGNYGAELICKSATDGEPASRACERPAAQTAVAWKTSLAVAGA